MEVQYFLVLRRIHEVGGNSRQRGTHYCPDLVAAAAGTQSPANCKASIPFTLLVPNDLHGRLLINVHPKPKCLKHLFH